MAPKIRALRHDTRLPFVDAGFWAENLAGGGAAVPAIVQCNFSPDNGPSELYIGHINRLGLDLGVKAGGVMAWGVFAPTPGLHHGALAGTYVGGSGSASLGVGLGANALIGGSHRSIALQPLSVEGQVGVNLALGVAGLSLRSAP